MKSSPFRHHTPTTTAEATAVLAELGDDAKVLAGGQSLLPMLALRLTAFGDLVDLGGITELAAVEQRGATLVTGATVRQRAVERDAAIGAAVPLLAEAVPLIGHFQIRNRGTIGGSVAHADPASELPACALALGATLEAEGPGGARRTISAADFFDGHWTTALQPDEVLVAVHWPVAGNHSGSAVDEVARRHGDFAIAGAAAHVELGPDGHITSAGLGLFGVGATPLPATDARAALVGLLPSEVDYAAVGHAAAASTDPTDDIHATAAQRRRITAHVTARAVERAVTQAIRSQEGSGRA